jgi:Arc/MetJ family transcription regulator
VNTKIRIDDEVVAAATRRANLRSLIVKAARAVTSNPSQSAMDDLASLLDAEAAVSAELTKAVRQ